MVISVKRKGKRRLLFVDLEFFGAEEGEEPETYHTHAAPRRCSTIRLLRHARNLHDAPRSVFRDKSIDRRSTCAHRERKTTIGSVVASMNEESEARADPLSGSAYISKYYTVTNGSPAFDTLQEPIPHITVYYICIHKLITFVTLLHLITPQ